MAYPAHTRLRAIDRYTALAFMAAILTPFSAAAQTATNTVDIAVAGDFSDPDSANNSATDSDTIVVGPSTGPGTMAFATSGNGLNQNSIALLDWSTSSLVDGMQNGDVVNFPLIGCRSGTLTATFSNVVDASSLNIRDMRTWSGASAYLGYNGPDAGEAIHVAYSNTSYTITWSLTINGQSAPLDLVMFDAESTNSNDSEFLSATTNGGAWSLIENIGGSSYSASGFGTQTVTITDSENPSSTSPVMLTKAVGRTDISFRAQGGQAVAFGMLIPCDYGDAPASYGDATHAFREDANPSGLGLVLDTTEPFLGTTVDAEFSSQPTAAADGDDTDAQGDDENGVVAFPVLTRATTTYTMSGSDLSISGSGNLYGWVDFDGNGTFDADEFASTTVTAGTLAGDLEWTGVSGVTSGSSTYVRLRFTTDTLTSSNAAGAATNGEVEDFLVTLTTAVDLALTKTNTPGVNGDVDQTDDTLTTGSTTTYTIVVTNNGPDPADGAVVTDTAVSGLTCAASAPVTITGDGVPPGSFTFADLSGAGIALGILSNGQSTTLSYSCQVN